MKTAPITSTWIQTYLAEKYPGRQDIVIWSGSSNTEILWFIIDDATNIAVNL